MLIKEIKTQLFADYFQFYIQDENVTGDLSNAWTDEAVDRLLALAPGTIGVGTVRNMDVPVTIKIFNNKPQLWDDLSLIHHINECDFETQSDKIVVAGCTDYFPDAMRVEIGKGLYKIRIYYGNLDKLSDDQLDGEDFYEIQIWPSENRSGVQILKNKNHCT
ncbi:hypothetical protein [Ulvibacterium marinum]|uniref:Uncharacterized protein n=1 Tax=Ulvibacterium marinum TaxID=2419782 RepID=A0A3B0C992_9FLAO|nr:hypothetical protein [Ulvibacterium marinum]RKN81034.1 hypothetical protein D7Z94_08770 [Ulvibacterium marinum]